MTWNIVTQEAASQWAGYLWMLLGLVWLVMWFGMKRAKRVEAPWEMLQHALPATLGFWLLFEEGWKGLKEKPFSLTPAIWWIGLALTAIGVGISIWARISLGANWSSVVTLKKGHELIRVGLYQRVRHPIYTGILLAALGTVLIKGHIRAWLALAVLWVTFYFKARREERFLRQEFGADYAEHARHTGMFLPKWT
jgi:protein-S-isoprenylcysteine O-methyltransferase Ste14